MTKTDLRGRILPILIPQDRITDAVTRGILYKIACIIQNTYGTEEKDSPSSGQTQA